MASVRKSVTLVPGTPPLAPAAPGSPGCPAEAPAFQPPPQNIPPAIATLLLGAVLGKAEVTAPQGRLPEGRQVSVQ